MKQSERESILYQMNIGSLLYRSFLNNSCNLLTFRTFFVQMAVSSSFPTHLIPIDPRVYCETMNELHSYITSSKRGYLTQAELFRYYRQRHNNAEIPYRVLGYRSLLDLLSSDQRLFSIDLHREPAYIYSAVKVISKGIEYKNIS